MSIYVCVCESVVGVFGRATRSFGRGLFCPGFTRTPMFFCFSLLLCSLFNIYFANELGMSLLACPRNASPGSNRVQMCCVCREAKTLMIRRPMRSCRYVCHGKGPCYVLCSVISIHVFALVMLITHSLACVCVCAIVVVVGQRINCNSRVL